MVKQSAGAAIPSLEHQPDVAAAAPLAKDAMITAAKQTTALASGVLVVGLLATLALPHPRREEEGSAVGSTGGTRSGPLPSVAERGSGNDRV